MEPQRHRARQRRVWEEASRRGDVEALRAALELGQNVDARDRYGQTALMRAAHFGGVEAVGLLIERGADPDVTAKFGLSALMLAVVSGKANIARLLVEAGADTLIRGTGAPGFAGMSAADLAAARGDLTLERLIRGVAEQRAPQPRKGPGLERG